MVHCCSITFLFLYGLGTVPLHGPESLSGIGSNTKISDLEFADDAIIFAELLQERG